MLLLLCLNGGFAFAENNQCTGLIDNRCQTCHYKSCICQVLGKKSNWEWKNTVTNMMRHGANLSDAEKETVIDCLSSAPVGAEYICKN